MTSWLKRKYYRARSEKLARRAALAYGEDKVESARLLERQSRMCARIATAPSQEALLFGLQLPTPQVPHIGKIPDRLDRIIVRGVAVRVNKYTDLITGVVGNLRVEVTLPRKRDMTGVYCRVIDYLLEYDGLNYRLVSYEDVISTKENPQ